MSLQGTPINNKVSLPDTAKFQFLRDNYQIACGGYACKTGSHVSRVKFTMSVPGDDWVPGAAARLARVVNNGKLAANLTSACGYADIVIPSGGLNLYFPHIAMPTSEPSISFTPTYLASSQPTRHLTQLPTVQPSVQPSSQPSAQPVRRPTSQPTRQVCVCNTPTRACLGAMDFY